MHIDNKNWDVFILGEELNDITFTSEEKYCINFTQWGKRFVLILHYNVSKSYLFVSATKIYQFKAEDSEIKDYTLCFGNISQFLQLITCKKQD